MYNRCSVKLNARLASLPLSVQSVILSQPPQMAMCCQAGAGRWQLQAAAENWEAASGCRNGRALQHPHGRVKLRNPHGTASELRRGCAVGIGHMHGARPRIATLLPVGPAAPGCRGCKKQMIGKKPAAAPMARLKIVGAGAE